MGGKREAHHVMTGSHRPRPRRTWWARAVVVATTLALSVGFAATAVADGPAAASAQGKPKKGGTVTYGLEAPTSNFCLPNSQLAISGIMVATALYDTLTAPTADGKFVPYLAQSVEHDPTYMIWTIKLRPNVTFHDGTPVDADAVKLNLDSFQGKNSQVSAPLFGFVFSNVDSISVVDPTTVQVNTKTPWVTFDEYLWSTGRLGMVAPAQLNSPDCSSDMIGSGPYKLDRFDPVTGNVDVSRNDNYWRKGYPYLDEIKFVPIAEESQRFTQFQGGALDMAHGSVGANITQYENLGDAAQLYKQPAGRREVTHTLINVKNPPFDDLSARIAIAEAVDVNGLNQLINDGKATLSHGVFDTKIPGYVKNNGYPKYNVADAKKRIAKYKKAHDGKMEFNYQSTNDQIAIDTARYIKSQLSKVGVTVNLPQPVDQPTIISQAIGGKVDAFGWRNYPGIDGDALYVWFYGTVADGAAANPVNFNHVDDPVINESLDKGRAEPDEATRKTLYETLDKQMSKEVYNLWGWYTPWFIAAKPNIKGVLGPNLPDASGGVGSEKPANVLAGFHQLLGIWKS